MNVGYKKGFFSMMGKSLSFVSNILFEYISYAIVFISNGIFEWIIRFSINHYICPKRA